MYARRWRASRPSAGALEHGGTSDAGAAERPVRVVAAYEAVVGSYPASGYSDNALWQGAMLAASSYARFRASKPIVRSPCVFSSA